MSVYLSFVLDGEEDAEKTGGVRVKQLCKAQLLPCDKLYTQIKLLCDTEDFTTQFKYSH